MLFTCCLATLLLISASAVQAQVNSGSSPASSQFDASLFYQLLLGEMNARDTDPGAGFSLILDAARKTGQADLFQRAIEIALQARAGDSALQAARAWKQAQPNSVQANRQVLQILVALNRLPETIEPIRREIALASADQRAGVIAGLPLYLMRSGNKKQAAAVLEQALFEHIGQFGAGATGSAAWTAVGRMRLEAGEMTGALEAARRAQLLDVKAEGPAVLALSLMDPARPQAEAMVRKHLEGVPRVELRMEFARKLLEVQRVAEAAVQVRLITAQQPEFAEAWLIQGMIAMQERQTDEAESAIKRFLALVQERSSDNGQSRTQVQAYLSLAQIAQQRQDLPAAEQWLSRITNPQDVARVQTQRAALLAQQGRLDAARQLIREIPVRHPADARMKLMAEVQLLREHRQYQSAHDLLADALRLEPDNHELLYDQATLAEKLGDLAGMERLLRHIIQIKPDYHQAYNALGYSLADRNIRLDEARALILKALEYAPGDPFITDSLGWVEFRRGNLVEAQRLLQTAYQSKPDAEIAAHLGEVLWMSGQQDAAMRIWREGRLLNSENETLRETFQRLGVTP